MTDFTAIQIIFSHKEKYIEKIDFLKEHWAYSFLIWNKMKWKAFDLKRLDNEAKFYFLYHDHLLSWICTCIRNSQCVCTKVLVKTGKFAGIHFCSLFSKMFKSNKGVTIFMWRNEHWLKKMHMCFMGKGQAYISYIFFDSPLLFQKRTKKSETLLYVIYSFNLWTQMKEKSLGKRSTKTK